MITIVELDHFRLPLSMDELPQRIPYLHRLYNAVEVIYSCCYQKEKLKHDDVPSGSALAPRVVHALAVKSSDRTCKNYMYHFYH